MSARTLNMPFVCKPSKYTFVRVCVSDVNQSMNVILMQLSVTRSLNEQLLEHVGGMDITVIMSTTDTFCG